MPSNPPVMTELLGKWQIAIQFSFSLSGSDASRYLPTALAMLTNSVSPEIRTCRFNVRSKTGRSGKLEVCSSQGISSFLLMMSNWAVGWGFSATRRLLFYIVTSWWFHVFVIFTPNFGEPMNPFRRKMGLKTTTNQKMIGATRVPKIDPPVYNC